MELSAESVLALAPDAASVKAATGLLKPAKWPTLGANDAAVWGECQGSGGSPYETQVDLSGPTFKCSCPSQKFPCKHALALLLLKARDASLFKSDTPPTWVTDWLNARTERAQKKQDKQREKIVAASAEPTAASLKSIAQRWKQIDAGVAELQQWLLDQVSRGLGSLSPQSRWEWQTMGARLVDAKAPGLGQRVNYAADGLMQDADWPEKTLRRLGLLQLACEAISRRSALSEAAQTDLRIMLGWPLEKETVLAQSPGVPDRWQVIGLIQEERDNNMHERRVWLRGQHSGQYALLLEHAFAGRGFEQSWLCHGVHQATLAFYPSAAPLRALVVSSTAEIASASEPASAPAATADIRPEQTWTALAQRIANNPWISLHPLHCHGATPCRDGDSFGLDWAGKYLPLTLNETQGWALLALSGGRPLSVMGEWNGEALRPLSASSPEGVWNWSVL
ncbi:MAG: SWIM zinc finger family protein [Pseudomonadota bacterium]|nr:SWIM zinc finger family protein [Pseudomonadota bacterium]